MLENTGPGFDESNNNSEMNLIGSQGTGKVRLASYSLFVGALGVFAAPLLFGESQTPSIYSPVSTPATEIQNISYFVYAVTGGIFLTVGALLLFAIIKFRARSKEGIYNTDDREPPQVYGSNQIEMAWTIIPILIVVVLFLTTARMIFAIQDAKRPPAAVEVDIVGHQYWWEYRYPKLGVVTANELHIPVSDPNAPMPTFFRVGSADVIHSFWVPQLGGKIDVVPNHPNNLWTDPHQAGVYLGQCAQFCGIEHALMLIRVYVDTPQQFQAWVANQQKPGVDDPAFAEGKHIFQTQACINCHTVAGTVATGRFGPDLTHFASRDTLASGAAPNTPQNLRLWIKSPDAIKPGCLMPAMELTDDQIDKISNYLESLK